jgi:alpha-tubulin suppressor-like RCC1 family protein
MNVGSPAQLEQSIENAERQESLKCKWETDVAVVTTGRCRQTESRCGAVQCGKLRPAKVRQKE